MAIISEHVKGEPHSKGKIVLGYSGGLDTSVLIPWLEEEGYDVVAVIAALGQPADSDIDAIAAKASQIGAVASYAVDLREEFAERNCVQAIYANAMYEGVYPLLSAISRPLIAKHLVRVAHAEDAVAVAHGCTGKGNDQVRFTLGIQALDPELDVLGPLRYWELTTRQSEIEYAQAHGVPVKATKESPYSIDENVWGRAVECGVLEDPWNHVPEEAWAITVSPQDAPDAVTEVVLTFEGGKPVAVDGKRMGMLELIQTMNKIGGENGFGRIDTIEDRLVGLKSRECYEQPGALAIIKAHQHLEKMCLPGELLEQKVVLEHAWARQVYNGLWYSALKEAYDAFFASTQKTVTGDVRLAFYKGTCTVTGVRAEQAMYDFGLATYDEGDTFDRAAAAGFMKLFGLQNDTWAKKVGGWSSAEEDKAKMAEVLSFEAARAQAEAKAQLA